ncbi:ParM/StbA family protein [Bacillus cereus]|nr:ParM/StbA family protein [Bacillus cereus]
MVKAQLILDLGNSQTRGVLRVGEIMDKTRMEYSFHLSNAFSSILEGVEGIPQTEDYNENNSIVFSVNNSIKIGNASVLPDTYVNGLMGEREFSATQVRPTALTQKYNSDITVLSIITAIGKSALWLKDYFASRGTEFPIQKLINDIEWELTVLLPPQQEKVGAKVLTESLVGQIPVKFEMPNAEALIKITKVNIMAEGMMAYMGVLLSKSKRQPRSNKTFMRTSKILVMDIGAGTTDLIVIDNGKSVERSKNTIDLGGNNIKQALRNRVQAKLEARLANEAFETGVITGKVKQGIKEHDVTKELIISKREIATKISNQVKEYLEASDIEPNSIEYILVVGGGSIPSENPEVLPISDYLLQGIKRFAPQVGQVDINDIITKPSSPAFEQVDEADFVSPRELNIVGAGTIADIREVALYAKQQQAKQA